MKERPILFSAPMVRAILDGRKTQTRRICRGQRENSTVRDFVLDHCPYGQPGDRLWVRETWARYDIDQDDFSVAYKATPAANWPSDGRWRPSIHMPRWASRITLEITDVRVERLQDMEGQHPTESDAIAEGVRAIHHGDGDYFYSAFRDEPHPKNWCDPADAFKELWEFINGPGSWGANPWVWVVEFRRVA